MIIVRLCVGMCPRHLGVRLFIFLSYSNVPVTVHFSYSLQTGPIRARNLMTKTGSGVVRKNNLTGRHFTFPAQSCLIGKAVG